MDKPHITTAKNTKKKGYALWVSENPEAKEAFRESVDKANTDYLRSLSGYGTLGEQLAEAGLSTSGYGEYLSGLAFATRQSSVANAKRQKESILAKGYTAYLKDYEKQRTAAEKSALSAILSEGIGNSEQAYAIAISHGLSHEDAVSLLERSASLINDTKAKKADDAKRQVLQKMIAYGFREADGIAYARAFGYSESEAAELAKLAEKLYRAQNLGLVPATYDTLYPQRYYTKNK